MLQATEMDEETLLIDDPARLLKLERAAFSGRHFSENPAKRSTLVSGCSLPQDDEDDEDFPESVKTLTDSGQL